MCFKFLNKGYDDDDDDDNDDDDDDDVENRGGNVDERPYSTGLIFRRPHV